MASSGTRARPVSMIADTHGAPQYHAREHRSLYSTAYNGSQGHIDDRTVPHLDFAKDEFDDVQLPEEPAKALTPTRPALGSRLLSSLSGAQPAAAGLARQGSLLHARARSLAGFVPKLNTRTEPSPERRQQRNPIFGDLFNGESAPVRIGITPSSPTKEESEFVMDYKSGFTERPGGGLRRRSTAQTAVSTTTTPLRAGWFSRKSTAPTSLPTTRAQDDILAIDINSALFPNGPADPLSPHSFNDLLLNATNLLQRVQTAYREKVDYIASIKPEIDAQREEVEEAETRAKHLKLQLEDMSAKAADQNLAMQEMAMQLTAEKMKVHEAKEASTVRLVRRSTDQSTEGDDEGTTPRRSKRRSGGSASDSGFESDADYADSVMSGGAETPLSPLPTMTITPAYDGQSWPVNRGKGRNEVSRQSSPSGASQAAYGAKRLGLESAAWATVDTLRGENQDLKRQMEEMQRTLQGCIEFVSVMKA